MPPKPTIPKKRAPPAFKAPGPASKSKPSASMSAPVRRKSAPARPDPSFSSSSSDNDRDIPDASDPVASASQLAVSTQDPPPTIPPKLLTKLLHHHFSGPDTRIEKDANRVVEKYMETFVREALARAAFERAEASGEGGARGGDFLEVEDLEKLAPQLILDF
ncbi:Centromere protein X [Lasallia pustulata]|uniref:Centromere protein X n=1 Tax=Lasallia pustulata TaxID=136370 RepID=A0A1W5D685_9LECA|nr:Centromere protein X [Lasallia pustulata]